MKSARIVIAGTSSGVGKTSITLGLARALVDRGFSTQTFKVGPDFLDPQLLKMASGRQCLNLDSWMTSQAYISQAFRRASSHADTSIIEGVMGMFDGSDPTTIVGSTAEAALLLSAPVILVVSAHGVAGSIAPMVKGFVEFHPGVSIVGVIANFCDSARHREMLSQALKAADLPPLLGAIPKNALQRIPERHLGVLTHGQEGFPEDLFQNLELAVSEHVDIDAVIQAAGSAPDLPMDEEHSHRPKCDQKVRIGLAQDKAFFFYYPDNLSLLEESGAEMVPFSPLADEALPPSLDALYIGGGYPEEYAAALSSNIPMLEAIRAFAKSGAPVYAECGGLMYISESLTTKDGDTFDMVGLLPASTAMLPKLRALGYAEVALSHDCMLGPKGTVLRGHEFHYSEIQIAPDADSSWGKPYTSRNRVGKESAKGFLKDNILASYIHLHFGSNPHAASFFVDHIDRISNK